MRFYYLKISFLYLFTLLAIIFIITIRKRNASVHAVQKSVLAVSKIISYENTSTASHWRYTCSKQKLCQRVLMKTNLKGYSLQTCQMICGKPALWPMPKRINYAQSIISPFNLETFPLKHNANRSSVGVLVEKAYMMFCENVLRMRKRNSVKHLKSLKHLIIKLKIADVNIVKLRLEVSESYELRSKKRSGELVVEISAETFFGVRHGLETLSQLIWWDEIERTLVILHNVEIEDEPAFPYRGLMMDTARNYFSLTSIKRNLRAMAASKLNVFHWHLTDSQSFPFISPRYPKLGKYGAYGKNKIYSAEAIRDIIEYAIPLGIRVIIEVDAPAHMYEGWRQLNEKFVFPSLRNGSGQLNPDSAEIFRILKLLYEDIFNLTNDDELFHIGGDEVDMGLWLNTSSFNAITINTDKYQSYTDVTKTSSELWVGILSKIFDLIKAIKQPKYFIIWSNDMMRSKLFLATFNHSNTIIQHWLGDLDILETYGYRVIFSDVSAWYLDCGFGQWTSKHVLGDEPCSYNSWDRFYMHSPWNQVDVDRVLGGEACLWSEGVGEKSLDARIWPRTAAFGEAVWAAPHLRPNRISLDVFIRLDVQTKRLQLRGIQTQTLWPEWCSQHPGFCT